MYLIRRQTIVPNIDYTITKMEFASINIRMTFTNTKVVTPSGTIILYIKHSTVINVNKSVNYFKQKYTKSALPCLDSRDSRLRRNKRSVYEEATNHNGAGKVVIFHLV